MTPRGVSRILAGVVCLALVLVTGCSGKKHGKITGTVTLPDGSPLPAGQITFNPEKGQGSTAEIEDGKYTAEKVPLGTCKVTLKTEHLGGQATTEIAALKAQIAEAKKNMPAKDAPASFQDNLKKMEERLDQLTKDAKKYRPIAAKYTTAEKTPLTADVKGGDNSFDFKLEAK